MIVNRQQEISVDLRDARDFVTRLRKCLRLGRRDFNVCFVRDAEIARMNATYRGKARRTDVLSFPWQSDGKSSPARVRRNARSFPVNELASFLGDIVISAETARRNARAEGHSAAREIRWLILHGALHLLGYDHETDNGDMTALEHSLRARLNI